MRNISDWIVAACRLFDDLHHPIQELVPTLNSLFFFRSAFTSNISGHFSKGFSPSNIYCLSSASLTLCVASWRLLSTSVESAFCTLTSAIINQWGQMLSKKVSKTLSYPHRSSFVRHLCFFCFFFTIRQCPSKGQSTLWQMRSFFHVNFWCFLPQYDATLQLAQLKGTDPCLTRCSQV